jgi:RimJ/RimL family protein N-acetyltransferase
MELEIRQLTPADAAAYIVVRREMLADSPWAFTASPEDDRGLATAEVEPLLARTDNAIVGAIERRGDDVRIVGTAGIMCNRHRKLAHRAHIWGVYVSPSARGRQVGFRLVISALQIARTWPGVTSAGLSASDRSQDAIRLYRRLGFRQWGIEPAAVMLDGHAYDEVHMVLFFDDTLPSVNDPERAPG